MNDLLVLNIGRLVTNDASRPGLLGVVEGAGVAIVDGIVAWIGFEADVPDRYRKLPRLDAGEGAVLALGQGITRWTRRSQRPCFLGP